MGRPRGLIPLWALSVLTAAAAQDQQPIRANVNLVQLSVIARDKQGRPVAGLRQDEFRVIEDGVPQDIRLFLSTVEQVAAAQSPRPPDVYTNLDAINATADARSGYSILLIDNLNTDFGDPFREDGTAWARVETLKMLRSLPAGEKISILALRWKIQVVCDFTTDRARLEQQLAKWTPSPDTPQAAEIGDVPNPPPGLAGNVVLEAMSIDEQSRIDAITGEIDQLSEYLAPIPGRKNLIWIANRFNADPRKLAKLARANVAIYPVDPAGVKSPEPRRRQMDGIAQMSGGLAFYGRNDLDVAIREAIDDGRVSYTLGYYRQGEQKPSRSPHKLTISVTRPGVTLRYRSLDSINAPAQQPPAPEKGKAAGLVKALIDPFDATGIPLTAHVTSENGFMNVDASLDVRSIGLEPKQTRFSGKLEVVARFSTAKGEVAGETFSQTVVLNLKPATYESMLRNGFLYHNRFKIPAKAAELKLLFGNVETNKIGSITVPIPADAAGNTSASGKSSPRKPFNKAAKED
jgi:VWFA-related protein